MTFWSTKYNNLQGTGLDVLNKFQYSVEIIGIGTLWYAKSVQFPKLSQEKQEAISGFGGNAVYKPGPSKWQPITLTFADVLLQPDAPEITSLGLDKPISTQMLWFSLANILDSFQQDSGFLVSRNQGFFQSPILLDKFTGGILNPGLDKLNEIRIHKHYNLDTERLIRSDTVVESWKIQDIVISELDFGQGDYSSDDINEVSVTLSYDIAHLYYQDLAGAEQDTISENPATKEAIKKAKEERKKRRYSKAIKAIY